MTRIASYYIACSAITLLLMLTVVNAGDSRKERILKLYPEADSNRDGVLSNSEEDALSRLALKRYPQADRDRDGRLSDSEKDAMLQIVANRAAKNGASDATESTLLAESRSPLAKSVSTSTAASPVRQGPRPLQPGACGIDRQIPNLAFTDVSGDQYRLSDFGDKTALVIALTGTGCPLCLKYAPTLAAIEQEYRGRDVAFIFVNPNESESGDRLYDAIQTHGFQGPYVSDGLKTLPAALGAETTTEVFVLDQARTLVYRGAVDDQYGFGYALDAPRANYLTDALDAVLNVRTPATQATSSPGCELFHDNPVNSESTITYHNRVSRIIQANCVECHRTDGIAPIALESYKQVREYAAMMKNVVDRGVMPPWFAAPETSGSDALKNRLHWANDRSLSTQEKDDLSAWIEHGAPEGDPADAPLPRTFPGGWLIGKPDATFGFAEPIPVKATGTMPYQYVTVETNLPEDKWIQAIEIRPGNIEVVHHVIVKVQSNGRNGGVWAAYAPGNSISEYPTGYARLLPKGASLQFQMHYTPNGKATEDKTQIGLIFTDKPPRHEVKIRGIANRGVSIPPHAGDHKEVAELRLPQDWQILSFMPHMHLRGKAARFDVVRNSGPSTLLDVPHYDFNWQLPYRLADPLTLRRGEVIRFTGWFDNSAGNPANPNPTRNVGWGEQTEDEMLLGYVEYVVPGSTPGESVAVRRSLRSNNRQGANSPNRPASAELRLGGQRIKVQALIKALRELDRNGDGSLDKTEVPTNHHSIFEALDANDDDTVTTEEVRAAIRQQKQQQ